MSRSSAIASSWPGLPQNIISRSVRVKDLEMHVLELRPSSENIHPGHKAQLVILLHGFPELAYSWRKVMGPLSDAGYHVVAPDQRGFGETRPVNQPRTTKVQYEDDISPYRLFNLVGDIVELVYALGYSQAEAIIGHNSGSRVAGSCAMIRPDVFKSVVMMSAPFTAPSSAWKEGNKTAASLLDDQLAKLDPPRKHYTTYYSTPEANRHMSNPPNGLHIFLRGYYHMKSADWAVNKPHPLSSKEASSFATMPQYYIMLIDDTMPESIARGVPADEDAMNKTWISDSELTVYVSQYTETGFQGGLNWYRCMTDEKWSSDLTPFAEKTIDIPAMFIAGKSDWGTFQYPGAAEKMRDELFSKMGESNFKLIEGAGHWVQQEKPQDVVNILIQFLGQHAAH